MRSAYFILFYCLILNPLRAQTLITDMGSVRFFNSMDSAKSVRLMALAHRCACLLWVTDSTHDLRSKLDLDLNTNPADTSLYRLDYNVLKGDFVPPADTISISTDPSDESPGIYIKIRDTVIKDETVLRVLDYGIHHYAELKQNKKTGEILGNAFVYRLIAQKPTPKLKRAIAYCK